jgi:hypothetical protein
MTTDTKVAGDTALSVDAAAHLLGAEPREKEDEAPETGASIETPAASAAEEESGSEAERESDGPGDADDDSAEEGAQEIAAPEPPRWWSKEAKARFASLPPELQAVVFQQEDMRERVTSRAKQEAAAARKHAEAGVAEVGRRLAYLDQLAPDIANLFQNRWANIDWSTLPDQVGADEAFKLKAQFEKERDTMVQLHALQQAAREDQFRKFVAAESEKLKTAAPELADETHGPERKRQLGTFLLGMGFPADRIQQMSADEAAIAYDAMRWRQAQAKASELARKQPAQQARPVVRPTAAPQRSNSQRSADDAMKRLRSTGRVDDAVALLNARG